MTKHLLFSTLLWVALLPLATHLGAQPLGQGVVYNIMAHGAVEGKEHVSTQAIQSAIDKAYERGGGTVFIPPGDFTSGTLVLKDNVTLYLEGGATLYASRDINDYRMPMEKSLRPTLIYANGAENISVRGQGSIRGQAEHSYDPLRKDDRFILKETENARQSGVEMKRYYIVQPDVSLFNIVKCRDILIEDVGIYESSFWTLNLLQCEKIVIRGIYLYSSLEKGVNADGIDLNCCRDVRISDCIITTGDDGIVVKSWFDEPSENITVTNCIVTSSSTALKLGTESHGDFRHILFNNCVVRNSNRGLSIVVRDGAHVEDVVFSNITVECKRRHFNWWGNADPIWIFLTKRKANSRVGYIKDVVFENIIARGMGTSRIESTEGMRIENVRFNNVQLFMEPEDKPDKRADHAVFANNVKDLHLNDLTVKWATDTTEPKWASAIATDNVDGLVIDNFRGRQGLTTGTYPVIDLLNTANVLLKDIYPAAQANTVIRVSGELSRNMVLQNIDPFKNSERALDIDRKVNQSQTIQLNDP